jgi:hypothetical protein
MSESDRQIVRRLTLAEEGQDEDYRNLSIEERWAMMWPLAVSAWAMRGEDVAEQEFQRHAFSIERRGR